MTLGAIAAATGGLCALAASLLLPFHAGGGLGGWIAWLFLAAGLLLAGASMAFAARVPRGGSWFRSWSVVGAAGFAVSGLGLVGDLLERAIVRGEIAAVGAVAAWWIALGLRARQETPRLAIFSLVCALLAGVAVFTQFAWGSPPSGAIAVRFAYVLWAPWGLALAVVLSHRQRVPTVPRKTPAIA